MTTLIVYGVLILGALAGVFAFLSHEQGIGAAKQLAKDKPMLEACIADKKTALDANASLQLDVTRMAAEQAEQNAAVAQLQARTEAAIANSAKAQAGNAAKVRALESDQAVIFRQAAGALKGLSCPAVVQKLTNELHELAVRETADRPPTVGPQQPKAARPGLSVQ